MRPYCDKVMNALRIFRNNLKHTKVIMKGVHVCSRRYPYPCCITNAGEG
jgi:hypothetical protein